MGLRPTVNLGVAARVKYGFLLDKMNGQLPVFRTETQDRMLKSAQNFAAGELSIITFHPRSPCDPMHTVLRGLETGATTADAVQASLGSRQKTNTT